MASKLNPNYWYVHGQAYDLNGFAKVHPGGHEQLLSVRGRDCTEMVHSMHVMASKEKVELVLNKYRVKDFDGTLDDSIFSWKEDGLYYTVAQRFKDYLAKQPTRNHKADTGFWVYASFQMLLWAACFYRWVAFGSIGAAFVAGCISTSLGFMLFHTAGHCGLSKNPKVNSFWFKLIANYVLGFISTIWDVHHNYGHHSYTGIHRKDPDVSNSAAFLRKTELQAHKPIHKAQCYLSYLLLIALPNQWLGQFLQYFMSIKRKKIFGVPMISKDEREVAPFIRYLGVVFMLALFVYIYQGFQLMVVSLYACSTGMGLMYWACVFPNHDTELAEHSSVEDVRTKATDWGEHQITHSSNFQASYFLTHVVGGMNYQIEHHLFPTVHPRFYPLLSQYVSEECKKRGIAYNMYSSWFGALRGNFRQIKKMSQDKKE